MKRASKILALCLSAAVAGTALSGCGTSGSSSSGGKKLTIWTYMQAETDTIKKYANQWAKKRATPSTSFTKPRRCSSFRRRPTAVRGRMSFTASQTTW